MNFAGFLAVSVPSRQCGYFVVNTGATFGDNTSPSNFDPLAAGRRQLAWYLWSSGEDFVPRISQYLPAPIELAPRPTDAEAAEFAAADLDELNPGVINPDGSRKPPPYHMHVDDNMYADVEGHLPRTICASLYSLFCILGLPTNPLVPSPLSNEKFESKYNHQRKLVGRKFDSRKLTVGILDYKIDQLRELLQDWLAKSRFELLELAQLLGILENHTRYARWARCWYYALQNTMRRVLHGRYCIIERFYQRKRKRRAYQQQLPAQLSSRIDVLIARDKAQLLWSTRQKFRITPEVLQCLRALYHYVTTCSDPWEVHLGLIVPRIPHVRSKGDASLIGGGAYSLEFSFWFDIKWSKRTRRGACTLRPHQPGFVHINALEFVVIILQLAAVRVRWDSIRHQGDSHHTLPRLPSVLVWKGETDNTVSRSWENKVTAKTSSGQSLVGVYAELLRTSHIHTQCTHIAGVDNIIADDISRNDFSLPYSRRRSQLLRKHPSLQPLDYFLPSPELVQLLESCLFSRQELDFSTLELPSTLGRMLPGSSTISGIATL